MCLLRLYIGILSCLSDELFWKKIVTFCRDTQAALRKCPHGKELRPAANSHVNELSWTQILQPQSKLQMTAAAIDIILITVT